jgi:hypothetical protein
MPGYLDRINKLKLTGQLDTTSNTLIRDNWGNNERNELNERTIPINTEGCSVILDRLLAGQIWLLDQHHQWQASDLTAASDAEFSRAWNAWWELDERLRTDYGFQGCVCGPESTCPDGFPCLGCSDVTTPSVVAQLALT